MNESFALLNYPRFCFNVIFFSSDPMLSDFVCNVLSGYIFIELM